MSANSKRKLGELDGSEAGAQLPTRQKMDIPASRPETAKEDDAQAPQATSDVSYLGERIVTVAVGPNKTKFILHEQVLSQAAENSFFHVAFNNGFKEALTGYLELPEDDPEMIKALVKWVYAAHAGINDFGAIFHSFTLAKLFELYIVAHKYLMNGLHDAIVSYIYSKLESYPYVWYSLSKDKEALECFLADVPVTSDLYILIIRSLAYSMVKRDHSSNFIVGGSNRRMHDQPINTRDEVDGFLRAMPDDVCRSIVETILTMQSSTHARDYDGFMGFVGLVWDFHLECLEN